MAILLSEIVDNPNLLGKLKPDSHPRRVRVLSSSGELITYVSPDECYERIGRGIEKHPIHTPGLRRGSGRDNTIVL